MDGWRDGWMHGCNVYNMYVLYVCMHADMYVCMCVHACMRARMPGGFRLWGLWKVFGDESC